MLLFFRLQYGENRVLSILALVHAFIQHANIDSLALLCTTISVQFAPRVENETQLIYYLRILTVYLMKILDRDKESPYASSQRGSASSSQYLQLIITIYAMITRILEQKPRLEFEDMICDVLYQFKYTVMGYSVNRASDIFGYNLFKIHRICL